MGDIVEGHVEPGKTVRVGLGNIRVGTTIGSVEVIEISYLGRSSKGLVFAFEDPAELGLWRIGSASLRARRNPFYARF